MARSPRIEYLGGESFQEKLQRLLDKRVSDKQRDSYRGEAMERHDETRAEKLMAEGLKRMGLTHSQLAKMKKTAKEKNVLAWWVHQKTVVSRGWITRWLQMGHETNVSNGIRQVKVAGEDYKKWKTLLSTD